MNSREHQVGIAQFQMIKGLGKEFLNFINRGNVVDLAVAVVIGAAFTGVVNAFVELLTTTALSPVMAELGVDSINSWPAGVVLVALLNFLIVAVVVFMIVKSFERMKRREAKADSAPDSQKVLAQSIERLSAALEERRL